MNELRLRIYQQIINNTPGEKTSLFNKICGVTIFISIFFAVIVTENSIDYKFGDQIDLLDWIIGTLFCLEYLCRLWVAPLEKNMGKVLKVFCVTWSHRWQLLMSLQSSPHLLEFEQN